MKKSNTSLIIRGIMLLLALIVMVFVGTQAWFGTPETNVVSEGLTAQVAGVADFDVAIGFKTSANGYQYMMSDYSKNLNLRQVQCNGSIYDALHDFNPIDVTSSGVSFIRPTLMDKNKQIDRESKVYTSVTPNKEYICFDMYFRSNSECNVYLDSGSFVAGKCEINDDGTINANGLLTDKERKSTYGDFSKDAVVGAIRLSFVEYTEVNFEEDPSNRNSRPCLLWLPRPDIFLESNASTSGWTLHTDVQPDEFVVGEGAIARDTYTHHYYAFVNGVGTDFNYPETVTQPETDIICTVNKKSNDGFFYGKTQVNIWVEGCDTEARRAISGGEFLVNFDLRGG